MPKTTKRSEIILTEKEKKELSELSQSRTAPLCEVQRAAIILKYSEKKGIKTISEEVRVSRPTVYKCIDKAIAMGAKAGLKDYFHRPKQPVISEDAKLWVVWRKGIRV
jgi:hypothetical protein